MLSALLYIINVNHIPVATFENFREMNRWVRDYRTFHPNTPGLSEGQVDIYRCTKYDLTGEKCTMYKHFSTN